MKKILMCIMLFFAMFSVVDAIQISNCQTINQSGNYELSSNLTASYSDFCLIINASNVSIAGNGFWIDAMQKGVLVESSNVSIRNMSIYAGIGIMSNNSINGVFENLAIHSSFNCFYAINNDYLILKNVSCDNLAQDFGISELDYFDKNGIGILTHNIGESTQTYLTAIFNNVSVHNFHVGIFMYQSVFSNFANINVSNSRDAGMILGSVKASSFENISIYNSSKGIMGYTGTQYNLFKNIFLSDISDVWLFSKAYQIGETLYPYNNLTNLVLDNQYGSVTRNTDGREGTSAVLIANPSYYIDINETIYFDNESFEVLEMFDYHEYLLEISQNRFNIFPRAILNSYIRENLTFKNVPFSFVAINHDGAVIDLVDYSFNNRNFVIELPITAGIYELYNGIYDTQIYKTMNNAGAGLGKFVEYIAQALPILMFGLVTAMIVVIIGYSILKIFRDWVRIGK